MTTPELQLVQTPVSSLRMDKVADIHVIFSLDYMVLKAGAGAAADASQDLHSANTASLPARTYMPWGSGQAEAGLQVPSLMS